MKLFVFLSVLVSVASLDLSEFSNLFGMKEEKKKDPVRDLTSALATLLGSSVALTGAAPGATDKVSDLLCFEWALDTAGTALVSTKNADCEKAVTTFHTGITKTLADIEKKETMQLFQKFLKFQQGQGSFRPQFQPAYQSYEPQQSWYPPQQQQWSAPSYNQGPYNYNYAPYTQSDVVPSDVLGEVAGSEIVTESGGQFPAYPESGGQYPAYPESGGQFPGYPESYSYPSFPSNP